MKQKKKSHFKVLIKQTNNSKYIQKLIHKILLLLHKKEKIKLPVFKGTLTIPLEFLIT